MAVLLIAEINNGALNLDATAKTLEAAKKLGDISVLCASATCKEAAQEIAKFEGIKNVLCAQDPLYAKDLGTPLSDLIVSLAKDFSHIVAPATTTMKNVLPCVAARLDFMIISEITEIIDDNTFTRPIYAGNAIQKVKSLDEIKVLSVRISNFDPAPMGNTPAPIQEITPLQDPKLSQWVEDKVAQSDRPELTSANIVVSGGRGIGSEDDFALIEKLADKLGAAVGASRAAVDSGYAPNDWQVGQTGKVVAPELYIAIGISGAIQHLAGMKDSKIIVAINKDEEAPIFQVADYGLVADLFDAVPALIEKI